MNCNEYIILISGSIDGTNPEKEEQRLQSHLAVCPHCRKVLKDMQDNDRTLRNQVLTPPLRITHNVMTAVRKDAAAKRRSRLRTYVVSIAAAAAVLCLVLTASIKVPEVPTTDMQDSLPDVCAEGTEPCAVAPDVREAEEQSAAIPTGSAYREDTPGTRSRPTRKGAVSHCVFVELASREDLPDDLPNVNTEELLSRVTCEARDYYYYGGSMIYGITEMSYEEMLLWEDRIDARFLQELTETESYVVVFCSESR